MIVLNEESRAHFKRLPIFQRQLIEAKQRLLVTLIVEILGFVPEWTSGYRSIEYERKLGIKSIHRQHTHGEALDALVSGENHIQITGHFTGESGIYPVYPFQIFYYYFFKSDKMFIHWGLR
jgi:hypothetical protein